LLSVSQGVRAGVIGTPLRNTSDHSEGEDNSDYEECVEDEMPSGECSRNGRRARLPEDPWERVSESSRVADMSEQAQWERRIRCVALVWEALPAM